MIRIYSFSTHYTALQMESSMKSISIVNPAIMEIWKCSIVKAHPAIDKMGVSLDHGVPLTFFPAISNSLGNITSKE